MAKEKKVGKAAAVEVVPEAAGAADKPGPASRLTPSPERERERERGRKLFEDVRSRLRRQPAESAQLLQSWINSD